jgi:hypothetical protein
MGAPFPGARVSLAVMRSPASVVAATLSGVSRLNPAFSAGLHGVSIRVYTGAPSREVSSA